ncbi:flagellar protein [Clostridium sp. 'deep sea']|uniref:TIGR02530 family flagellar biosynthesis protein n=1 Tax=Clostridium sp. 'deep sea' TaxID=2779445 RepID=UPI0018965932|nr:TIGR02530 family flagellar biosynthesis protein [Clostridium sp. 'deep sea']QOR35348.1 flagellar protein [Clostridium sp. 'deep sea']
MSRKITNFSINEIRLQQSLKSKKAPQSNNNFNDILQSNINNLRKSEVKFSKHANERLAERNITLTGNDLKKVSQAIDIAKRKGINNSLIVTDEAIYIANTSSRTVITAMQSMKGKVFTNVDGVVNI